MREELKPVLQLARTLAPEQLPALIGELAEITVVAQARLAAPRIEAQPDELLDVRQAAARLHCSTAYLYRHHKKFPFTRPNRVGRALRFSASALDAYLRRR